MRGKGKGERVGLAPKQKTLNAKGGIGSGVPTWKGGGRWLWWEDGKIY